MNLPVLAAGFILMISCSQPPRTPEEVPVRSEAPEAINSDTIRYKFSTLEQMLDEFRKLNYTPEAWQGGAREIPNIHLESIPERWREKTADSLEVRVKKRIFFYVLAPLALDINGEIRQHREELLALESKGISVLSDEEKQWLRDLATAYKVADDDQELSAIDLTELKTRVDEIPISLPLAQSAEESGWGTSRFAAEGNALFGQWAWGKDAIKPKEQRSGLGDYGLARFDSPLESMRAYMHNLNTHNAYRELRALRAKMRSEGQTPDGSTLAGTLTKYSERGQAYVESLRAIIRVNHLAEAEKAILKAKPVILMIPEVN